MSVIVHIIESERGWGQRVDEELTFPTVAKAKAFVEDYNKVNDKPTPPDWYMYAKIVAIDGETIIL